MSTQQNLLGWINMAFTDEENELICGTWHRLVDEEKVVFGHRPPVARNMKRLLKELRKVDANFKAVCPDPLPSTCKKYKTLNRWVGLRCNDKER